MKNKAALSVGTLLGLVLTAAGALVPTAKDLPVGMVASVNGKSLSSQELAFALTRLHGGAVVSSEQRGEALNYLIDQELLVQRGVEIGLLESDHTIRKAVSMAMIDTIVAEVLAKEPSTEGLRQFYESHRAVFSTPTRLHVQHIFCDGSTEAVQARARAEQAREAITHGLGFSEARERYGDVDAIPLLDELTPLAVLRRVLGPTLSDTVLAMRVGEVSVVPSVTVGFYVFGLAERDDEHLQPFERVEQDVRAEYLHRQRDEALQQYLDRFQREAAIVLSPKASRLGIVAKVEP